MGRLVLVVDDDETTRRAMVRLLNDEGHVAEPFASGALALERLRKGRADVLLTDLVMPEMSGLELVDAARVASPGLRCFIMTGHSRPSEQAGLEVEWVSKPVDIDRLLERIAG